MVCVVVVTDDGGAEGGGGAGVHPGWFGSCEQLGGKVVAGLLVGGALVGHGLLGPQPVPDVVGTTGIDGTGGTVVLPY